MGVLSWFMRFPAASPSNPSERTRYAQKAEARDDGPTGPVTSNALRRHGCDRPFSSRPGSTDSALYKDFDRVGKGKRPVLGSLATGAAIRRRLDISGFGGVFR